MNRKNRKIEKSQTCKQILSSIPNQIASLSTKSLSHRSSLMQLVAFSLIKPSPIGWWVRRHHSILLSRIVRLPLRVIRGSLRIYLLHLR